MAKLIPTHDIDRIENEGERIVVRALVENLPGDVEVLWSLKIDVSRNARQVLVREGDVVVVDPRNGVMVIEVKGGAVSFDTNRNLWVRRTHNGVMEELRDPAEQSQTVLHALMDRTAGKLGIPPGVNPPFTFGYAVCFPNTRFSGDPPPYLNRSQIIDGVNLSDILTSLENAFGVQRHFRHGPMNGDHVEAVRRVLLPEWKALIHVASIVTDAERGIRLATNDQQRSLLGTLAQVRQAKISGPAGTGKTVIARAKAFELAQEGKRVAFLCYNRSLSDWIASDIPHNRFPNLKVSTFHQLASALCREAGVVFVSDGDQSTRSSFWDETAPELMTRAIAALRASGRSNELFDAVVVDEGQDFAPLYWTAIDDLFDAPANERTCYVFYDPHQNVRFGAAGLGAFPQNLQGPFTLTENCRNTQMIGAHCASLVGIPNYFRKGQPVGVEPTFEHKANWAAAAQAAGQTGSTLCARDGGGLSPNQVVILAPAHKVALLPNTFGRIQGCTDVRGWRDGHGILRTTPAKFKGLEAAAIISVEEAGGPDIDEMGDVSAYVARTRAKASLHVITYPPGN